MEAHESLSHTTIDADGSIKCRFYMGNHSLVTTFFNTLPQPLALKILSIPFSTIFPESWRTWAWCSIYPWTSNSYLFSALWETGSVCSAACFKEQLLWPKMKQLRLMFSECQVDRFGAFLVNVEILAFNSWAISLALFVAFLILKKKYLLVSLFAVVLRCFGQNKSITYSKPVFNSIPTPAT